MTARLSLVAFLLPAVFGYKASADVSTGIDSASLLQKPSGKEANASVSVDAPHIIGLRRESVPIYRRGKIASFKTSYSGVLSVGYPPQDFRVVFDTGSAHIILPAMECKSEACLANNRRHYDQRKSSTSLPINADGSIVHEGDNGEQVTIGFGTGDITGEFAKDTVCFGKGQTKDEVLRLKKEQQHQEEIAALIKQESLRIHDYQETQMSSSDGMEVVADHSPMCMEMNMIVAIEMSTVPFKTFKFDGILGLSLDGLAMNRNFSTFDMLVRNGLARRPHFGVFLTDSEDLEPSQVAFGGADPQRMLEPITWSKVYRPDLGYWVVPITAVRVDGVELDVCKDGTCRGVVDTGTSHLGVPGPYDKELANMLKVDAGDLLDCRLAKSPKLEIDLDGGKTIELFASSYMRRLPLREGVSVSSEKGVTLDDKDTKKNAKTEVLFERPGYVQLKFGSSSTEMKCIRPKDPVLCLPEAANRRDDIYGDKFHVHVQGENVCVNRTDIPGGWGMDLTFHCPEPWVVEKEGKVEPGMEAIYLAELEIDEERCYNTFAELTCPNTREFTVRSADHKKVCVTRKYLPVGKASDVLRCKVAIDETLVGLEEVVIGPQESQEDGPLKCVTPAKPVTCEKDAGNRRKDNFPDSFEIFSQKDQICAKRMDGGQSSWALNLIIFCRPQLPEAAEETRTIDREEVHLQQGPNDPPAVQEESSALPEKVTRHCSPRLMAVNLPEPLGPKLFILGEPVLHRYYTVYDWEEKRVGFSLANMQRNTMDMSTLGRGALPKEVDMLLMQRHMEVRPPQLRP